MRVIGRCRAFTLRLPNPRFLLLFFSSGFAALAARAHGFEERYDLPVPLHYVVIGACAMVLLTFLVALLFVRRSDALTEQISTTEPENLMINPSKKSDRPSTWPAAYGLATSLRALSLLLFSLTVSSALWGSADPLMNLSTTMVWIVWWIGLSFVVMVAGNVWPLLDPWRSLWDAGDSLARKLGMARGLCLGLRWPVWIGMWPAVFLLLAWCWLEVVYPIATSPSRTGLAALIWSALNLSGMVLFGPTNWQRHADVFSVYFAMLGRINPLFQKGRSRVMSACAGQVGFVLAMLSTVMFDGLHGGSAWLVFEQALRKIAPQWLDINGYFAGTAGLLSVWLVFLVAYRLTCRICNLAMKSGLRLDNRAAINHHAAQSLAELFVTTLIPIAGAYLVAHNFSNLLIQGQRVFQLMSDPFGRQWDLLGTARFYPDIAIVDAQLTWTVAVVAIVLGHAVSVWQAHALACRLGLSARRIAWMMLPLTLLMVAYTAVSLIVIAEPMVSYNVSMVLSVLTENA